jgi:hypothetical protein
MHEAGDVGVRHGLQSSLRDWLQGGPTLPTAEAVAIGSGPSGTFSFSGTLVFQNVCSNFVVSS